MGEDVTYNVFSHLQTPSSAIDKKRDMNEQPQQNKAPHNRSWWRHQMETYSALLAFCVGKSPVTCEFPAQRPVTQSFDDFFDLHLNKQLSKQ